MDNMKEVRKRLDNGNYEFTLDVVDSDYFNVYSNVDLQSGEDLLRNYLQSSADDASFDDLDIRYNKNRHIVRIKTELNYDNGEHKRYDHRGKLM